MCRKKKKEFFYPEDIVRVMYPEDWKQFFPELETLVRTLYEKGEIEIEESQLESLISNKGKGKFKIRCLAKPKS